MDLSLDQEEAAFLKDVLAEAVAGPPRAVQGALKPTPGSHLAQAGSALPAASTQNHVHAQPPRTAPLPPGTPPVHGGTHPSASRPPHPASKQPSKPASPARAASSPAHAQVLRPPPIRMQSSELSNRSQGVAAPGAVAPAAAAAASRHPGQAYTLPSSPTRSNSSRASFIPDRRPQSGASQSVNSLPSLDANSAARKEKEQERQAQAQQQLQVVRRLEVQVELLLSETASGAVLSPGQTHQGWVHVVAEGLVRDYNKAAVALMDAGASSEAKEQLDRALTLAGERGPLAGRADLQRRMQALTHNNLALCYRRMDQSDLCVRHLELAAQLEVQQAAEDAAAAALSTRTSYSGGGGGSGSAIPAEGRVPRTRSRLSKGVLGSKSLSGGGAGAGAGVADAGQAAQGTDAAVATLLSLAAASSSVGRHQEALSYSHRAVLAAARELQVQLAVLECALLDGLTQVELCGEVLPQLRAADPRLLTQLAMAYFNRAVEQEHLQQWYPALESYRFALDLATRFAGKGSELTLRMQKDSEAYKARLRKLERSFKVRPDGTTNHTLIAATLPGADGSLPHSATAPSSRSRSPNGRSSRTTSTRSLAVSACGSRPSSRATTSSGQASSPQGPTLPSSSRGPLASTRSQQRISHQPQPLSSRTSLSGLPTGPLKGTQSARGRFAGLATEPGAAEGPRRVPVPGSSSLDGSSRQALPAPGASRTGPAAGATGRLSNADGMARSGAAGGGTAGSGANGAAAESSLACGAERKEPVAEKAPALADAASGGGQEGKPLENSGTAAEAAAEGDVPPPVGSGLAEEAGDSRAEGDSPERLSELSFAFDSAVRPKLHQQQTRASPGPGDAAAGEQHGDDGDGESVSEFWDSDESESGPSFFADRLKSVRCTTKRVSDAPLRPSFDIKPWQGPQQEQAAVAPQPADAAAGECSPAAQPPKASIKPSPSADEDAVQDLEVTFASGVDFPAATATAAAQAGAGSGSGQEDQVQGEENEGEGAESEASMFWDSDESESGPSFLADRLKSVRCTTKRVSDAPLRPSFSIKPWQGPQQQQGAAEAEPVHADATSPAIAFAAASEPAPAGDAGTVAEAPASQAAPAHSAAGLAETPGATAAAKAGQDEEAQQGDEATSEASEFWDSDESESGPSFLAERLKSVRCTTKRVSDAPLKPSFEIKPLQNGNAEPTTAPAGHAAPTAALPASLDHATVRSVPSGHEGLAQAEPVAPMRPPSGAQRSSASFTVTDPTLALAAAVAALPRPPSGRGASDGGHNVPPVPGANSMLAPKRNGLVV